jgi:hypothetical protein
MDTKYKFLPDFATEIGVAHADPEKIIGYQYCDDRVTPALHPTEYLQAMPRPK